MNQFQEIKRISFITFLFLTLLFASFQSYSETITPIKETFTLDSDGYRIVSKELLNHKAKKFFIMAGDSNVFGDGLKDQETLPIILSGILKKYDIYNWGIRGGGPHDTLYFLQNTPYQKRLIQKDGIFVYNFYPFLFERIIGSKNYMKWSRRNSPYYFLNEQNEAEYSGRFSDRSIITPLYQFINHHNWLDFLIPKLPQIHRRHIKLTAAIFFKMQEKFLKDYPSSKFIVILNNSYTSEPSSLWQIQQLEKYLKDYHVAYIKVPYIDNFQKKYTFNDGHINYEGQKLTAQLIAPFFN